MNIKYQSMFGDSNPAKRPGVRRELSKIRKMKIERGDDDIKIFGKGLDASKCGKKGFKDKHHTLSSKEKLRIAQTGRIKSEKEIEDIRKRTKGKNNPNWKGGIQYEPYTRDFDDLFKEFIRKRDNYTCQFCGITEREYNKKLDIHHIDFNKFNSYEWNCISLCRKCHAKANHNRNKSFLIFSILLLKRYLYPNYNTPKILKK